MGFFKLGTMTLGSLFKKPETVQYPFETKQPPAGLKGHIVVNVDDCILCGLCMRNCPTESITVDKPAREWRINPFSCIQCGYCTTVCPKKCLVMDPAYWTPGTQKDVEVFAVPEKEKPAKAAKAVGADESEQVSQ